MTVVTCTYTAMVVQNAPTGSITLKDCSPAISNEETMGYPSVIAIVAAIVVAGLAIQWISHRVNKKALSKLKADLRSAAHDLGELRTANASE